MTAHRGAAPPNMIGGAFGKKGSAWPVFGVLAVLCGLGVAASVVVQHRALEAKVREAEARAGEIAGATIAPLVASTDVTRPLPGDVAARVTTTAGRLMAPGQIVRVRIHSTSGVLVYSSDATDDVGGRIVGDPDAIRAAAADVTTSAVEPVRVAAGESGATTVVPGLQIYVPVRSGGPGETAAVLQIDQRYRPIEEASMVPWRYVAIGAAAAAVLFVLLTLVSLTRRILGKRRAARSGFDTPSGRSRSDQAALASLRSELDRTRSELEQQEQRAAEEMERFQEQLRAAVGRAEAAESRGKDAGGEARSAEERLTEAVARADVAEARATAAEKRAELAESRTGAEEMSDSASAAAENADAAHDLRDAREAAALLERQLTEVEHRAARAEQEAEAARDRAATAEANVAESQALVAAAGQAETKIAEATRRATDAERKTAEAEKRAAHATTRADELATRVTETERELAGVRGRLAELDEVPELRGRLDEARLETERRGAEAEQHRQMFEEAARRADAAEAAARDHEVRASEHAANVHALETSAAEDRATARTLEATLEDVERRVGDTEKRARRFEEELVDARETLGSERRRADELAAQLEDARTRLRDVDDRIRQADRRADAAESRMTASAGGLSAESARLRTELEAEIERGRRAVARANEGQARASDLETHASKLAQALEEERILREQVGIALTGARVELDHARTRALELEARVDTAERAQHEQPSSDPDDLQRLRAELEELRTVVADQESELTTLRTNESGARRELQHARSAAERSDAAWIDRTTALEHELAQVKASSIEAGAAHAGLRERAEAAEHRADEATARAEELRARVGSAERRAQQETSAAVEGDVRRLRVELADAVDRATRAEEQATRVQEEMVALIQEIESAEAAANTGGNGDARAPEQSLRFRLARAADRKKGRLDEA